MINPTDCLLVMGRRGCGKSYLAKRLQDLWPRRVIFDTLNEYTEGETVHSFLEFTEKISEIHSLKPDRFTLIIQFDVESVESQAEFEQMLRILYYHGNLLIVIEEIHNYSSPHVLPHWLKQCILTGRHQNLALLFTTQRPGELNKTILSQCAHIFCGNIVEGNDLRYVSSFLRQSADKLISLPDRKFIYFSKEGVKEISNDF